MNMEFLHSLIPEGFAIKCPEKKRKGPMLIRSRSRALKISGKGVEDF
jgi:hypothetical protein